MTADARHTKIYRYRKTIVPPTVMLSYTYKSPKKTHNTMYQSNTSNNRIDDNSNDASEIEPTKVSQPEGRTSHNEDDLSIHDFDFALIC